MIDDDAVLLAAEPVEVQRIVWDLIEYLHYSGARSSSVSS
jgi:hypothetical protein